MEDGSRTRDLVLLGMSETQIRDWEEHLMRAIRLARHNGAAADVIVILVDQLEAVDYELQCRADEGNVPF